MRRIAIWSAKGGSGKTLVATNLAAAFARRSRRVLLMDLDPQACLLRAFGEEPAAALHPCITGGVRLAECVRATEVAGLHLIAASPDLDTEERLRTMGPGAEEFLGQILDELDPQRWDLLLIDCPPGINRLCVSALVAAREHLAPLEPVPVSLGALAATLDLAEAVRNRPGSELAPTRILLSRVDKRHPAPPAARELRRRHPGAVLDAAIPAFADRGGPSARLDSFLAHEAHDPAHRAFDALAAELLSTRPPSGPASQRRTPEPGIEAPLAPQR